MITLPDPIAIIAILALIVSWIITLSSAIGADERREEAFDRGRKASLAELRAEHRAELEHALTAAEAAGADRGRLEARAELAARPEPPERPLDPAGYFRALGRIAEGTTGTLPACDGTDLCQCPDHRPDLSAPGVIKTMITGQPWAGPEPGTRLAEWAGESIGWQAAHAAAMAEHYGILLDLADQTDDMIIDWPTLESVRIDRERRLSHAPAL